MTPDEFRALTRPQIRKLAREGKLIETAFRAFQRTVFPGAPPDQVEAMRACFFAGARELWSLQISTYDEDRDATGADMDFMGDFVEELEHFHRVNFLRMSTSGGEN